ncbi:cysteine protease [Thermococcus profundus]|uniref:Cysteine protease n=1 Tax=Thermococcus profundus TaxID=49899 RepID=A0A2Z2MB41_THEPR|nr:cysteine protease [Thermococcus profundus]ASJ02679.1 cysteine protease [Thermococcus profundus]
MGVGPKVILSVILAGLLAFSLAGYAGAFGGGGGEGKLEYKVYNKDQIMSGAYKVYGNPKLGFWVAKVVLRNTGKGDITDIRITYSIDRYATQSEKSYPILVSNGTIVDLYFPILSSEVTKLTASTPVNLHITIRYKVNGEEREETITRSLSILGVNDFVFSSLSPEESTGSFYDTFNNAPLLAAWVTPSDPVVREFADMGNKLAGGAGASLSDDEAIKSLSGMWELALRNGFSYKTEATEYWTGKFSEHIMFPRDVIRDKSGTCVDLALWFSSLAMSQGLKAYIVLMPGHAFPLIELPSGAIIPVEATAINSGVSFQEAVQVGMEKSWQMAMSGPHFILNIAELQSEGIAPPELPQLPADILSKWGITLGGANQGAGGNTGGGYGGGNTGGNEGGNNGGNEGNTGGNGGNNGGNTGGNWATYNGNYFSFQYPADWGAPEDYGGYVYMTSPDGEFEFMVLYAQGAGVQDMVYAFENSLQEGGITINARQETQSSIAGMTVYTVIYSLSSDYGDYAALARYFTAGGMGFAVVYDIDKSSANYDAYNQLGEYMVSTFQVG